MSVISRARISLSNDEAGEAGEASLVSEAVSISASIASGVSREDILGHKPGVEMVRWLGNMRGPEVRSERRCLEHVRRCV